MEFATRGIREVASAVNSELDSLRDARLEQEKRQQAFRQDLASLSHDIRTPWQALRGICSFMNARRILQRSSVV